MSGKRVLIPGGAGFLGSHLTDKLLSEGYNVTVWDNLHSGRIKNIKQHFGKKEFSFSTVDIRSLIPDIEVDVIINMACPASPPHYQADPIYTWETSILGVHQLLRLAKKNDARFLHASTSEVYGDPMEHPQKETYWGNVNPAGIRSCYDEGKRAAETISMDYFRYYGLDVRLFRIFNTYGPRMHPDDGRVVSNFCVQSLKGKKLTVHGDGKQTRSFCFVADLIDGIFRFLEQDSLKEDERIINLGTDREFTMLELAELVQGLTGSQSELEFLPFPADDPKQRKPDLSKANKVLRWQPKVILEDGLKETIEYFRSEI